MVALVLAALFAQAPANVVENPSFVQGIQSWEVNGAYQVLREGNRPFLRISTDKGANPWDISVRQPVAASMAPGQAITLRFRARSPQAVAINAMVEINNDPYTKWVTIPTKLTPRWQQYEASGKAETARAAGTTVVTFHLGLEKGTVDLADIEVITTGATFGPRIDAASPVDLLGDRHFEAFGQSWATESGERIAVTSLGRTGPEGTGAIRVVSKPPTDSRPWDVQLGQPITQPVRQGDVLYATGWMRGDATVPVVAVFELNAAPNTKSLYATGRPTKEWTRFAYAARAAQTFGPNESIFKFFFGGGAGTVELAGVRLQNFGPNKEMGGLVQTLDYFGGASNPDSWRAGALARIEKIRKGDLTVRVLDAKGRPIPGATVQVNQQRHAFRFGTAGPAFRLVRDDADSKRYQATVERLFNTFVFENDLKWYDNYEQAWPLVDQAMGWLEKRKFDVRGHNLVWGSNQYLPASVRDLPKDQAIAALRERIMKNSTRFKGRLYVWDVVNEAVTEKDLWDKIGWEYFGNSFKWARAADPSAKLAYNDFNITNEAGGTAHRRIALERVDLLRQQGAPVDIFGDQAHMGVPLTPISRVLDIWDEVAKRTGLPIEITEFDASVQDDKVHGQYSTDYLIAAFSHPKVDAFVMWGFWEGQHWLAAQGGAMFRRDWSARPAAVQYEEWVKRRWWTRANVKASAIGVAKTRAFYGDHLVTVTTPKGRTSVRVSLKPGQPGQVTVRIP